ncbi:MAG: ABC transporter ATP-binding protein [Pseudomonadota bacterium]
MRLEISDITAGYPGFTLTGLSLTVPAGSHTVLIGSNGCGKSTLLKAISRQLALQAGRITFDGVDIAGLSAKTLAQQTALLPQHPIVPPGITVKQLVGYGRAPYQNFLGLASDHDRTTVAQAIEAVDLTARRDTPVTELSGGQRQRAFLAMCIAQDSPLMLFDEPTSFLDIRHQYEVLELMAALQRDGKTVVTVLHDIALAARYATNLVVMKDGAIYAHGTPADVVTAAMVQDVYGLTADIIADPNSGTPMLSARPMDALSPLSDG